jgi:hypothetical protein
MVDFWEMNNQAMEVDAEKLSSRQFNWFFNYMCYKESYSTEDERSPKQVLRLYNQCFQFGLLVTHVFEKPVKLFSLWQGT